MPWSNMSIYDVVHIERNFIDIEKAIKQFEVQVFPGVKAAFVTGQSLPSNQRIDFDLRLSSGF